MRNKKVAACDTGLARGPDLSHPALMPFATWLTERAAERGLSLPQVARKISVAAPTVQAWARGARAPTKIAHVRAIARWTGATEAAVLAAILAPDRDVRETGGPA